MSIGLGMGPSGFTRLSEAQIDLRIADSGTPSTSGDIETFKDWLVANGLMKTPTTLRLFEVLGTTEIDVDPTAARGVDPNGWVAKVSVTYDGAATLDPTMLFVAVTDPGFDATGTTTVTRSIRGIRVLRHTVKTADATTWETPNEAHVGDYLEAYIALDGEIYAGTTITNVFAGGGFYGAAPSGYVPLAGITNDSAFAYRKPGFSWVNFQHDLATGTDVYVEGAAQHYHAMNGQQVPRIEYTAKDSQGTPNVTATQTASLPELSTLITSAYKPEVYPARIPQAALTQGDLCFTNARVYPWIGDSTAILDLEVDGVNTTGVLTTTQTQTPLRFVCDKTGGYGGAYAYVKAGASGGTVSATAATARAAPYPTIEGAAAAIQTFNNANKGHNDAGGAIIRLMDDGAGGTVGHVMAANWNNVAYGNAYLTIEQDPLNTARAFINLPTATVIRAVSGAVKFRVDIQSVGGNNTSIAGPPTNANSRFAYDGVTVNYTATGTTPFNYRQSIGHWRNSTVSGILGAGQCPFAGYGATADRNQTAAVHGCTITDSAVNLVIRAQSVLGGNYKSCSMSDFLSGSIAYDRMDGAVIQSVNFGSVTFNHIFGGPLYPDYAKGIFIGQVVSEFYGSGSRHFGVGWDDNTSSIANALIDSVTFVGERLNYGYQDNAGAKGKAKDCHLTASICNEINIKTETYNIPTTSGFPGNTQNWKMLHHVGEFGNVVQNGSRNSDVMGSDGVNPSWLGDGAPVDGNNSWRVGTGGNSTSTGIPFVDDKSGLAGTGGGDYRLTGTTNPAYDRVPAGKGRFRYDILGNLRFQDGSGAAGAYERTM